MLLAAVYTSVRPLLLGPPPEQGQEEARCVCVCGWMEVGGKRKGTVDT